MHGPGKPLDFGNGLVAGSVAGDGGLLVLGGYHPELGYATLDTAAPFEEGNRHDPLAVRAHRSALAADSRNALGLHPPDGWSLAVAALAGDVVPQHRLLSGALEANVVTFAPRAGGRPIPAAVQRWRLRRSSGDAAPTRLQWAGRVRLGRAAMTQLTEGGVLPVSDGDHFVETHGETLTITVDGMQLAAAVAGMPGTAQVETLGKQGIRVRVPADGDVPLGGERELTVAFALGSTAAEAAARAISARSLDIDHAVDDELASWRAHSPRSDAARTMVTRALAYVLCCCALPVDDGTCLITDHRILPLSWTRDAYYVARMLLVASNPTGARIVRRHLRWLFTTCERDEGAFARAYLPNGRIKDRAFQLDQQCYPLLELADYTRHTGDTAVARALAVPARHLLHDIQSRRTPDTALFPTDETPGDDPLSLPYHFSSHVLLWHTLNRLTAAAADLGVDARELGRLAAAVRREALSTFSVKSDDGELFAYAVDGAGAHLRYHDANDLPTVLAPVWGFCAPDDPTWRSTMRFAFSPANTDGYYPGPFGGLGSVHTPGAWPLGDVQELLYARLTHDHERATNVVNRLAQTACADGALPEARDQATGDVRSRHWFAWPGAALALALLDPEWADAPR